MRAPVSRSRPLFSPALRLAGLRPSACRTPQLARRGRVRRARSRGWCSRSRPPPSSAGRRRRSARADAASAWSAWDAGGPGCLTTLHAASPSAHRAFADPRLEIRPDRAGASPDWRTFGSSPRYATSLRLVINHSHPISQQISAADPHRAPRRYIFHAGDRRFNPAGGIRERRAVGGRGALSLAAGAPRWT
jgi:hypothetical protein